MPSTQASPPTRETVHGQLRAAGFQVTPQDHGRFRVQKESCAAEILYRPEGRLELAEGPGYLVGASIARLEDEGYQKFLVGEGVKVPALAEHLHAIHRFSEELKAALGLTSLYNESLGTVSDIYVYDRLRGREKDQV